MVKGLGLCMIFECLNINSTEEFPLKLQIFRWIMHEWFDVLAISSPMQKNHEKLQKKDIVARVYWKNLE